MAEAEVAGEAEQDVEADGEDREDRELLQQVRIGGAERLQPDRHGEDDQREDREDDQRRGADSWKSAMPQASITPRRPSRPRGRTSRITTAMR